MKILNFKFQILICLCVLSWTGHAATTTQLVINVSPGAADNLRTAGGKINTNFSTLFNGVNPSTGLNTNYLKTTNGHLWGAMFIDTNSANAGPNGTPAVVWNSVWWLQATPNNILQLYYSDTGVYPVQFTLTNSQFLMPVLFNQPTNVLQFANTNSPPITPSAVGKWISVQVQGETNAYRIPLYQ